MARVGPQRHRAGKNMGAYFMIFVYITDDYEYEQLNVLCN